MLANVSQCVRRLTPTLHPQHVDFNVGRHCLYFCWSCLSQLSPPASSVCMSRSHMTRNCPSRQRHDSAWVTQGNGTQRRKRRLGVGDERRARRTDTEESQTHAMRLILRIARARLRREDAVTSVTPDCSQSKIQRAQRVRGPQTLSLVPSCLQPLPPSSSPCWVPAQQCLTFLLRRQLVRGRARSDRPDSSEEA
jgi:hypothetical protein